MQTKTSGSVFVGIDHSDGSRAAIRWAAATATAHHLPLTFVHGYVDLLDPPTRGFISPEADLRAEAEEVVDRAEAYLRSTGWTEPPVLRIIAPARPQTLLTEQSGDARMVVVGRRGTGGFRDMLVGSTAYGVAEQCEVPVVIVPHYWDFGTAQGKPVVIGLDEDSGDAAIAFAFDFASRTSERLEAVHVVPPPVYLSAAAFGGYWPSTEGQTRVSQESLEEQRRTLSEQLAGWQEKYPDVEVQRTVEPGYPAAGLIDKASEAGLLVVGGRDHGRLMSALIGSAARNVMHHATCPLAVVHAPRQSSGARRV